MNGSNLSDTGPTSLLLPMTALAEIRPDNSMEPLEIGPIRRVKIKINTQIFTSLLGTVTQIFATITEK
ncbi:MAG: hypothetical protein ABIJ01_12585, partial [Pseudomonadota bacterium]